MNRSLPMMGLAILIALPGIARGQAARTVSIGATGGLSLPLGDVANSAESGYSVAGHIFFKPASKDRLVFRGDVSYDRWGAKPAAGNNVLKASLTSLGFVANALVSFGSAKSSAGPYLLTGLGLYRTNFSVTGSGAGFTSESSDMGLQGGGGLAFSLKGMSTFVEAKYVSVFRSPTSWTYLPVTFGVRF